MVNNIEDIYEFYNKFRFGIKYNRKNKRNCGLIKIKWKNYGVAFAYIYVLGFYIPCYYHLWK